MEQLMPDLAKLVTFDLAKSTLYVDDTEFPWCISENGVQFDNLGARDEIRSVTVTFYAGDVQVMPKNAGPTADA